MVANHGTPRWAAVVGLCAGAGMLLSAAAHGIGGWASYAAHFADPVVAAHVDADIVGGLHAGWVWGSFAMLAFGCIVLSQSWRAWHGKHVERTVVAAIAVAYVGFGAWAFVLRGKPHFLAFVVTGLFVSVLLRRKPGLPVATSADGG